MSEASSYHHDYHGHPDTRYYADPGEHPSSSVHRNRYSTGPRRVRDVSWISQQPPSPTNDPYARWHPPSSDPIDFPTPVFPDQPLPMAHSSPMMGRAPSPGMRMPSPMIGEYMTVEDPEYDEEELPEDNEEVDFDFSNAPQHHTDGLKGARRWVGGFVKGLRKFPGLRKHPHRPSPSNDFVPPSLGAHHDDDVQFPTIASLRLRPLTPTGIAQTAELMNMPQPPLYPQPSPQHHAYQQQPHVHRPPPPAASSPVYAPGADAVPQVLSTVDERSSEQTGTHETHPHPHFSADHTHSPRTHTHAQPHSRSHSRSHSNSHSHSRSHSNSHSQSHSLTVQPVHPNTTFTVTDYVTVPSPRQFTPPRPTPIKRFLHNLDQLPWVEHEQIVDAYFPGRSSRHRRHPESPVYEGKKPVASWYNKRQNSLPQGMGVGPSSASLLYGWPPQMQKAYSHQGMVHPQFPNGYVPVQPAFVYPATTFSLPPRMY
ncbi:uncharacterized protein F5891DRAFT_977652 [Suillus fuscotomentosus]|uniref:Uncharacterized protein n=1 Tax=Suillus fuscotomentosus TaxID=1912939 RepID=A0AAD4EC41_9AGAM|nr:uncharacterized protein F5891DRAFT_977652 [Suillus fuscotomentosus]KAG1903534.1 hypothetical protein F5891DRAFT_977652 [Suillus fuscotomentosus]